MMKLEEFTIFVCAQHVYVGEEGGGGCCFPLFLKSDHIPT